MSKTNPDTASEFEKAAADSQGESLVSEFLSFLAHNKKWWLLPIVIVMLLLGRPDLSVQHRCCAVHLHTVLTLA